MKIGFLGMLTIVMVILKSLNKLTCSWFVVFLPMFILILFGIIKGIIITIKQCQKEKNDALAELFKKYENKEDN